MQPWIKKLDGGIPRLGSTILICNGRYFEVLNGVDREFLDSRYSRFGQSISWQETTHWKYLDFPKDFPIFKDGL